MIPVPLAPTTIAFIGLCIVIVSFLFAIFIEYSKRDKGGQWHQAAVCI